MNFRMRLKLHCKLDQQKTETTYRHVELASKSPVAKRVDCEKGARLISKHDKRS